MLMHLSKRRMKIGKCFGSSKVSVSSFDTKDWILTMGDLSKKLSNVAVESIIRRHDVFRTVNRYGEQLWSSEK